MSIGDDFHATRWDEFQTLKSMVDHWYWRPGWHVGRSFYTFHLTFEDAPQVRDLVARYQEQFVGLDYLDPVPLEWLHLTMQGIGFSDEVSDGDLDAILAAARKHIGQLAPFTALVGPADGDSQGTSLRLEPWEPLGALLRAEREAIADIWGSERVPDASGFFPHVTAAYANREADPSELRRILAELRGVPPAVYQVSAVSLIRLNRDHKVYQWESVAKIELGNS